MPPANIRLWSSSWCYGFQLFISACCPFTFTRLQATAPPLKAGWIWNRRQDLSKRKRGPDLPLMLLEENSPSVGMT